MATRVPRSLGARESTLQTRVTSESFPAFQIILRVQDFYRVMVSGEWMI